MLVNIQSNQDPDTLLMGMQTRTATLENNLTFSYNIRHIIIIKSTHSFTLTQETEDICSHKETCIWIFMAGNNPNMHQLVNG